MVIVAFKHTYLLHFYISSLVIENKKCYVLWHNTLFRKITTPKKKL